MNTPRRTSCAAQSLLLGLVTALAFSVGCSSSNGIHGASHDAGDRRPSPVDASPVDGASGGILLPHVPDNVSISPVASCTMAGIGATKLFADAAVTILDVSTASTGAVTPTDAGQVDKPYCLVKVRVAPQVNIWAAMPMMGWNGRIRAEGGGGYSGLLAAATDSVQQDFVGLKTDTGHPSDSAGWSVRRLVRHAVARRPEHTAPDRLRLSLGAPDGRHWQAARTRVLRSAAAPNLLVRLLDGWPAGPDDGPAFPRRLRRDPRRRAGHPLGSLPGLPDLAADGDEPRRRCADRAGQARPGHAGGGRELRRRRRDDRRSRRRPPQLSLRPDLRYDHHQGIVHDDGYDLPHARRGRRHQEDLERRANHGRAVALAGRRTRRGSDRPGRGDAVSDRDRAATVLGVPRSRPGTGRRSPTRTTRSSSTPRSRRWAR